MKIEFFVSPQSRGMDTFLDGIKANEGSEDLEKRKKLFPLIFPFS